MSEQTNQHQSSTWSAQAHFRAEHERHEVVRVEQGFYSEQLGLVDWRDWRNVLGVALFLFLSLVAVAAVFGGDTSVGGWGEGLATAVAVVASAIALAGMIVEKARRRSGRWTETGEVMSRTILGAVVLGRPWFPGGREGARRNTQERQAKFRSKERRKATATPLFKENAQDEHPSLYVAVGLGGVALIGALVVAIASGRAIDASAVVVSLLTGIGMVVLAVYKVRGALGASDDADQIDH